jgi:hypothetical protein
MNINLLSFILSVIAIIISAIAISRAKEGFDATGLVFNKPSEWFNKSAYDVNDWLVYYEPDQISKPECMHYRGNAEDLNYLSSAYRFWRM